MLHVIRPWQYVSRACFLMLMLLSMVSQLNAASAIQVYPEQNQYAAFPKPLELYQHADTATLGEVLSERARQQPFNVAATLVFVLAVLHTFVASIFQKWSARLEQQHHKRYGADTNRVSFGATLLHFLGEIEVVFGLWVIALVGVGIYFHSWTDVQNYLSHDVNFTEPLFVIVVMAIAASRPVVQFAESCIGKIASLGKGTPGSWWLSILSVAPLLGSLITEPAAMTLAAMLLMTRVYSLQISSKLAYGTLGLLFVNVSIGGTLTHFAAPPILIIAAKWNWDSTVVFSNIGWKSVIAIVVNSLTYYFIFRKELQGLAEKKVASVELSQTAKVPWYVTTVHLAFLAWTVATSHYPVLFIGGLLFFIGYMEMTRHHQYELSLRSPILVGFFLAALVIHGGCQGWWIEPLLTRAGLPEWGLMLGAGTLSLFNDNAAITYLASQAPGLSDFAKYVVVAGSVAAGGMTVIANAPNPAGQSILGRFFEGGISPIKLALAALFPTVIALILFWVLKSPLMQN